MPLRVDYDAIASAYDRRYQHNDFSGIARAVTSFVGTTLGARVVEVGCGTGRWLRLLRGRGTRVVGMDASFGMLSHAPPPVLQAVAEQLPWPSRSIASFASTPSIILPTQWRFSERRGACFDRAGA